MLKSTKGIFKHIEESDSPKFDAKELHDFLAPAKKLTCADPRSKGNQKLWRVLPNGDWVRLR